MAVARGTETSLTAQLGTCLLTGGTIKTTSYALFFYLQSQSQNVQINK